MHLGKAAQKKRLKAFEKDPLRRWRVTKSNGGTGGCTASSSRRRSGSSVAPAPTRHLGTSWKARTNATVALRGNRAAGRDPPRPRARVARGRRKVARARADRGVVRATLRRIAEQHNVLASLNMSQHVGRRRFKVELEQPAGPAQPAPAAGARRRRVDDRRVRGMGRGRQRRRDPADHGRARRPRLPGDPDRAAPTDEERAQHYLWRFWRHLSRAGRITIFDRSWYGRVLVERVEGFATEDEWMRAYARDQPLRGAARRPRHPPREVLDSHHQERAAPPLPRAPRRSRTSAGSSPTRTGATVPAGTTTQRPSTRWSSGRARRTAPWTLVEGNDKNYARVKILATLADRMKARLRR